MFGSINIMLVSQDAMSDFFRQVSFLSINTALGEGILMGDRVLPNAHAWSGDTGQLDSARETLVTLRIIIFEADLYGALTDGAI